MNSSINGVNRQYRIFAVLILFNCNDILVEHRSIDAVVSENGDRITRVALDLDFQELTLTP